MNKTLKMSVLMFSIIAFVALMSNFGTAFAQTVVIQGLEINTTQAVTVIFLGVGAGVLVAYQGYRTTKDDWDTLKFFDGVIYSVLASVPLAVGTALTQTELGIFGYVTIFFASLGIGYQIKQSKKSTIPSNEG